MISSVIGGGGIFQIQSYWLMSQQLTEPTESGSFRGWGLIECCEKIVSIQFNFV